MSVAVYIPVRLKSSRLPNKAILKIGNKTMVEHVFENTLKSKIIKHVFVATCDPEIYNLMRERGANVIMTSRKHKRATDRVYEAYKKTDQKTIILKNGSRIVSELERKKISTRKIKYSMDPFEFSKDYYEIYKNFLNYLTNVHKKEVILLMSPYQLSSYELTIKTMPYYIELEKKIREFGQIKNVKIIGSFNSSITNCDENEFDDAMHPKNSCLTKIIKNIN